MKTKDNPDRREPWNLTQLASELQHDLQQCHTQLERDNARAFCRMDMKDTLARIRAEGRRLTPGEVALCAEFCL